MWFFQFFVLFCAAGEPAADAHWAPVGPAWVTAVAVAVDPARPRRWAVLTSSGEVLVTDDAGARWGPGPPLEGRGVRSRWSVQDRLDELVADAAPDDFGQDLQADAVRAEALDRLRAELDDPMRPRSLRFGPDGALTLGQRVDPRPAGLPAGATAWAVEGDVVLAVTPSGLRRRVPGPPPVVPRDERLDCAIRRSRAPGGGQARRALPTVSLALSGDDGGRPPSRDLTPPRRASALSVGLAVSWDLGRRQQPIPVLLLDPSRLTAGDVPTARRASERRGARYRAAVVDRTRDLLAARRALATGPPGSDPAREATRRLRIAEIDARLEALVGPGCGEAPR